MAQATHIVCCLLFTLGFLRSFVLVFVAVYYTNVLAVGYEPLISLGVAFFMSFALMKSEIVEKESYDDIVQFLAGHLT